MKKVLSMILASCVVVLLGAGTPVNASAAAATGGLRYTIAVSNFENRSNWTGQYNLGDAYGAVLTDVLNQSGKFIVLAEKDMRAEAASESNSRGTAAQLLVKGVITHVQNTSSGGGGIGIGGFIIGGSQSEAEINVTMYIVEAATGRVLASKSIVGKSNGGGVLIGGYGNGIGGVFGNKHKDNMGKAVENAISQAAKWMTDQLPSIPWTGTVVLNDNGNIYINRGTREGVTAGQTFIIGSSKVLKDPTSGEVLDETINEVARVQVDTVKEKVAICSVISGSASDISEGMRVILP
ncbi:curli production assembly/transport component csgg [Lucifera butyrica]|uniref:Curli production assembly/transport component csgg n=1 Tax=Lucifera butyrica TaxID=1351585 RepID=A0A498RA00_9FIRM|nr:CsgG/HfaB family protein [Lucifera butyrica]VBB08364.1 curli production assembly/transport component csgg [Lucifera butyrica]